MNHLVSKIKEIKDPFVCILVGPPLSGKTFFINELVKSGIDFNHISRDQIVLDLSGEEDYGKAFSSVDQKKVDSTLIGQMSKVAKDGKNAIIDMTNMTRKRRKYNLSFFPNHYKICIVFPILSDQEYERRNKKRESEEKKFIPMHIVKNMIGSYQTISSEEGFDKVMTIK